MGGLVFPLGLVHAVPPPVHVLGAIMSSEPNVSGSTATIKSLLAKRVMMKPPGVERGASVSGDIPALPSRVKHALPSKAVRRITMSLSTPFHPGSVMASRNTLPFTIHSIGFAHSTSPHAIPLCRPETNGFITSPEWVKGAPAEPVAYVRGSKPTIRVVFRRMGRRTSGMPVLITIGATCRDGPGVKPRIVRLRFNAKGLTGPLQFSLDSRLPTTIGELRLRWEWHVLKGDSGSSFIARTDHEILLAWKRPVEAVHWHSHTELAAARPGVLARRWVYTPIMRWVCRWAAGQNDAKAICDAIIANASRSKLKYAVPAWTVRLMLKSGGGYCGGWYRMFQAMAGSQGVRVERRTFLVDWPAVDTPQLRWCAIVVENPGINRELPQDPASKFHDANTHPLARCRVRNVHQRRYRFWGSPGKQADGHCINFLLHEGRYYLYDACFFTRAIHLRNFRLPPTSVAKPLPVARLGSFKRDYLDRAVDHMLGSVKAGGNFYRCIVPNPAVPGFQHHRVHNGLTVRTELIATSERGLAFYWRP
jgi:hypothetical protein